MQIQKFFQTRFIRQSENNFMKPIHQTAKLEEPKKSEDTFNVVKIELTILYIDKQKKQSLFI
jgi:hypothetical protein